MFGEIVQTQRSLGHLLMLEKGATSTLQCADRGKAGWRNSEFDAQMIQHTGWDHLNRIERRSGEPQETDLQRHAQPVQRSASTIDILSFILGKREEMRNFRVGQIVRKPFPAKVLSKWSVHDSILLRTSLHTAGKRLQNLAAYNYQWVTKLWGR
jgi:hypothetical protein